PASPAASSCAWPTTRRPRSSCCGPPTPPSRAARASRTCCPCCRPPSCRCTSRPRTRCSACAPSGSATAPPAPARPRTAPAPSARRGGGSFSAPAPRGPAAPLLGGAAVVGPPPARLEYQRSVRVDRLKHPDGSDLKVGDRVLLQAFADDFDDVTPGKEPA